MKSFSKMVFNPVIFITLLSIIGCKIKNNNDRIQTFKSGRNYNPVGYDLSNPDKIDVLPGILHEISGITEIDNSTIACIQDENGILVIYDLSCYNKKNNMLLIGPKSNIEGKKINKRAIYGFSLETKRLLDEPVVKFDLEAIKEYAIENKIDLAVTYKKKEKSEPEIELRTSAIGIHPVTNKLFLISGVEHILFVFDLDGNLEYMEKLDPKLFNQPEGITFLNNGDMLISNEGGSGNATLLRFNYKLK
ncbi:MAG: hypothetical protein NTY95_07815 [Bacteroidia bacterium]|nr:hypothetical protein [Bacteroidia bacterium]